MKTRLYYRISTGQWLHRMDVNSPLSVEEAMEHCVGQFALAAGDVAVVETEALAEEDLEALRLATDWVGAPPDLPGPSDIAIPTGSGLIRPVPPPVELTPDEELEQAIEGASTLEELKDVLLEGIRVRTKAIE